jgi:peptidylprolyl isomerase
MKRLAPTRALAAVLALPLLALTACGSSGPGSSSSSGPGASGSATSGAGTSAPVGTSTSVAGANTDVGIRVDPKFGGSPTLTIPDGPAPTQLTQQVLTKGTGRPIKSGDLLVANYVGQTWAPKSGKPNVFDSSFSRGQPAAFAIGTGKVIPGWDKTLVGKNVGSRVLLTIPPADGYGSSGQPSANIAGTDTLVFVVDLVTAYHSGASAPGTAITNLPAGLPKFSNVPAKEPKVTSTKGVSAPKSPESTLVVKGSGPKIDSSKTLVMEFVESAISGSAGTQSTWQGAPQVASAQSVLGVADALKGQNVGSRAVVLLPATAAVAGSATQQAQPAEPAQVLIVDVVGQF